MECGGLLIGMLLMMSGDIESNPGPSEYLSTYIFVVNITKSIIKLTFRRRFQTTLSMLKSPPLFYTCASCVGPFLLLTVFDL